MQCFVEQCCLPIYIELTLRTSMHTEAINLRFDRAQKVVMIYWESHNVTPTNGLEFLTLTIGFGMCIICSACCEQVRVIQRFYQLDTHSKERTQQRDFAITHTLTTSPRVTTSPTNSYLFYYSLELIISENAFLSLASVPGKPALGGVSSRDCPHSHQEGG